MYTYIVAGLSLLTTHSVHRDDPSSRITSRRPPRRERRRVAARRVAAVQMGKYQTRCMENIPRVHQSGKCFPWKIFMKISMVSKNSPMMWQVDAIWDEKCLASLSISAVILWWSPMWVNHHFLRYAWPHFPHRALRLFCCARIDSWQRAFTGHIYTYIYIDK